MVDVSDFDKILASCNFYVGDVLENTVDQLETTLEALYGNGSPADVDKMFAPLMKAGMIQDSPGESLIGMT